MASQLQQFSINGYINSKSLFLYNSTHKFMFNEFFFGSTSDFALTLLNNWYPSIRLLRFSLFFFLTQEQNLCSTRLISFNAIYLRSTIFCIAIDRCCRVLVGLHRPPFWKTTCSLSEQMDHSSLSKLSIVLPPGSFRACEKDFKRRHC